jgi:hypothetical protein
MKEAEWVSTKHITAVVYSGSRKAAEKSRHQQLNQTVMKPNDQKSKLQLVKTTISKLDDRRLREILGGNKPPAKDLSIFNCTTDTSCGLYYCDTGYLTL